MACINWSQLGDESLEQQIWPLGDSLVRIGAAGIANARNPAVPDQHAPFSDNVANRRYDQNLSRRHGRTDS